MTKCKLVVFCILIVTSQVVGQTRKDIETKYGPRERVYSISEHLWMTPTYDGAGQLCMMRIYPKRVSTTTNYLYDNFDIDETLRFLNATIPIQTRGNKKNDFGMSDFSGHVIWTSFTYDHVAFVFISSFTLTGNPKDLRGEQMDLSDLTVDEAAMNEYRRQQALKSDDQLIRERALQPQVLEIHWPNRKCGKP